MSQGQFRADSPKSRVSTVSLDALRIPRSGKTYDLSSGWWTGMPLSPVHPAFQVMTFRTPAGERNQGDLAFLADNKVNFGFISELLMGTMHTGTHIDALAHVTCGPHSTWHGGYSANTALGDFGPLHQDASELPPMLTRGVMLDIPALKGIPHLGVSQAIDRVDLQAACARQKVKIGRGDVVLIRTGTMLHWPDKGHLDACADAGLSLDGAQWLFEQGISAVGGDNVALEVAPSGIGGDPQPVHRFLIHEQGIPILEWVYQEDLARENVSEFLFVCLPLPITGATGSLVRPLAIV
jgi:kynurenine formamidase